MSAEAGTKPAIERMRLDLWLWRTRFYKTRTQAAEAIADTGARIERDGQVRRVDKGATLVEVGDLVNFTNPAGVQVVEVKALPGRRGPAREAASMYRPVGAA